MYLNIQLKVSKIATVASGIHYISSEEQASFVNMSKLFCGRII